METLGVGADPPKVGACLEKHGELFDGCLALVMSTTSCPALLKGLLKQMEGCRIVTAFWAYHIAVESEESLSNNTNPARLLDEAARLESVDRKKAIAAYEEIARLCPATAASREALRNIEILRKGNG